MRRAHARWSIDPSFASKAAEQAARIAGVLTLWENVWAQELSAEAMANGIELAQFYLSEAARLADAAIVSAEIEKAETLRKWLLGPSWPHAQILPSEVVRHAPIRALRESPAAKAALATLEKHGWVVRLPEGTEVRGVARKEAFHIVRAGDAFDPRRYLEEINQEPHNHEMRWVEGPPRAIRAIRAIPPEPPGAISTFSTGDSLAPDPDALLALLRERGPMTYGAAASALGWGATRAWRAEAALRACGNNR